MLTPTTDGELACRPRHCSAQRIDPAAIAAGLRCLPRANLSERSAEVATRLNDFEAVNGVVEEASKAHDSDGEAANLHGFRLRRFL